MKSAHPSQIISFFACRRCTESGKPSDQAVFGLVDARTLRIWCKRHSMRIADFTLAVPITPRCDVCGEEIGPDHKH